MAGATPPGPDERNPATGVQRPSLFSASGDDTVRIEADTSIMAALDGRQRKPPPSRTAPLWGAVGAIALAMILAAWWWQDNGAAPSAPVVAQAASVSAAKVAVRPPEAASAVASASASAVLANAESSASAVVARAVIEETATGDAKAAPVLASSASASSSAPSMAPAVAALATVAAVAKGHEPKPAETRVADTRASKTASAKDSGKANDRAAAAKPAEPDAAPTRTAKAHTQQSAEAAPATAGKDADVELLAALMRYSDEVATPGAGKAKAQSGAARMNELTIADLVHRCKALGGDEAMQCKKRICSGYWGKAEACPAKQAPLASKHKKQAA